MKLSKQLVREVILLGIRFFIPLGRFLPWKWGVRLGGFLGVCAYHFLRKERQKTIRHLTLALGDRRSPQELQHIARDCFAHFGMGFFELVRLPSMPKHRLVDWVEVQGEENLIKALKQGRGVIYVGGHIGNWELMAAVVAMRGHPLKVIAAPIYDPRLDDLMAQYRRGLGVETIRRGSPRASRQILSGLRQGCMLAFLIDQNTRVEGATVDFLGRPAYTPTGVASLALHSDIPVIMGYSHRLEDGRHRIVFTEPLTLVRTGQPEKDIVTNTAIFTKCLEEFILMHPEQWVWMHRRWERSA